MNKTPKKVVLLLEISREYGRRMVQGIARYAQIYGPWTFYREDLFMNQDKETKENFSWIKKWGADGVISRDSDSKQQLQKLGIPIISVRALQEQAKDAIEVVTDNQKIAEMAYQHFVSRGFKNFAIAGFGDMIWSKHRRDSFIKIINDQGHQASIYDSNSTRMFSWDKEYVNLAQWLHSLPKPVGILCCNDDRGRDILEACSTEGIRVPFDISVLGVDNDRQICDLTNPPLSSISLSTEKSGCDAAAVLDKLMNGIKVDISRINVEPIKVHARQSTDTYAINDPCVVEAMQFIKSNESNLIQVSDVLNAVGCSRRGLDEKFHRTFGYTVFNEIRRIRIECITRMLLETDASVSEIALKLGYNDSDHIARFFRKEKKMTPSKFRNTYANKNV